MERRQAAGVMRLWHRTANGDDADEQDHQLQGEQTCQDRPDKKGDKPARRFGGAPSGAMSGVMR
ncbi:hypothetical protein [Roseitalea porphyridii]|jgi:hypothetical protein|uniref:hypothetical protein n=1 Tax=Roseitalea porphyridii TaxID=1852022 RepID=UPI0032EBFD08